MDNTQLKSIAVGVLTGHWPAHLGLHTDAEKIEYLARQLEAAADNVGDVDELQEKFDDVEEERDELQGEIKERESCAECELCGEHKASGS